jgi:Transglutaminase-like superfamily
MIGRSLGFLAGALALTAVGFPTHARMVGGALPVSAQVAHMRVSSSGTVHLQGGLHSAVNMTMTGAFSVGHVANLSWDLPSVRSMSTAGYDEQVAKLRYHFSVAPDSSQDLTVNGAPIHRVTWNAPPANTVIRVTEHLKVRVTSGLATFHNAASYPVTGVTGDAARFLSPTSATRLPTAARSVTRSLARGKRSERAVVEAVMNWVASHTQYGSPSSNSASAVFAQHTGTCAGYTNLAIAMLRSLNIPAQSVYGWAVSTPIQIRTRYGDQTIQWSQPGTSGELHAWLNVYFPGAGWVPFDPQLEKFFVDPRHVAFLTSPDASDVTMGQWSGYPLDNASATGHNLSNGYIAIIPGSGDGGKVTVHTADSFQVHIGHEISDVSRVTLYSR